MTDRDRLAQLEQHWAARFAREPKLPIPALLSGAVAMALGFGFVMFLAFAWLHHFPRGYVIGTGVFGAGTLAMGLHNRFFSRRWFREVQEWHAQREVVRGQIGELRAKAGRDDQDPQIGRQLDQSNR